MCKIASFSTPAPHSTSLDLQQVQRQRFFSVGSIHLSTIGPQEKDFSSANDWSFGRISLGYDCDLHCWGADFFDALLEVPFWLSIRKDLSTEEVGPPTLFIKEVGPLHETKLVKKVVKGKEGGEKHESAVVKAAVGIKKKGIKAAVGMKKVGRRRPPAEETMTKFQHLASSASMSLLDFSPEVRTVSDFFSDKKESETRQVRGGYDGKDGSLCSCLANLDQSARGMEIDGI